jgi:hypothetical protein
MKTWLIKSSCYFKSIWFAIIGRNWYEKTWIAPFEQTHGSYTPKD